jgi:hypothetical protein
LRDRVLHPLVLGGCLLAACPAAAPETPARPRDSKPVAHVSCAAVPEGAVGLVSAEPCDQVIVLRDGELRVIELREDIETGTSAARGQLPERCGEEGRACELSGVATAVGPMLLLARRGPHSEMPEEVSLGFVDDGQLVFVPLWVDPPATELDTEVGPVFALEPRVCGESLVLIAVPRLPSAGDEAPSPTLRGLEGRYRLRDGEVVIEPWDDAEPCERVPLALP